MTTSPGTMKTIRIGTRGSRLARWQAEWVADQLRRLRPGLNLELVEIKTHGDRDRNSPLAAIGGVGLFTKEIQRAVHDGSVDVAVHSLKDLPTQVSGDLVLAAVPLREDVADALIAPKYGTIGDCPRQRGLVPAHRDVGHNCYTSDRTCKWCPFAGTLRRGSIKLLEGLLMRSC